MYACMCVCIYKFNIITEFTFEDCSMIAITILSWLYNWCVRHAKKDETNVNAKEGITVYMETEHEMFNILISDNRTITEM